MGRQSSRIIWQGQDHKEMIVWNGSEFVYHDKAYIWNKKTKSFQLIWEKYKGLKLLYESVYPLNPVSSQNNKYLYFTENNIGSIVYRIKIDNKNTEPEEWYTSSKYTKFTAPRSSRGFALYAQVPRTGSEWDYSILNLEDGSTYKTGHFNGWDYFYSPVAFGPPNYTNQELSPAESGMGHSYASILGIFMNIMQNWNYLLFISPNGISAYELANREGNNTLINNRASWDIGRLNDGTARGLLPRILTLTWNDEFKILEAQQESNLLYVATVTDDPPFSPRPRTSAQGNYKFDVVRDGKLPIIDDTDRIWIVEVTLDNISYTDTGFDSYPSIWDVSPDYKYVMTFNFYPEMSWGALKIWDMNTKKLVLNVSEEISGSNFLVKNGYFVGHKCIYIEGYHSDHGHLTNRYLLYKWR